MVDLLFLPELVEMSPRKADGLGAREVNVAPVQKSRDLSAQCLRQWWFSLYARLRYGPDRPRFLIHRQQLAGTTRGRGKRRERKAHGEETTVISGGWCHKLDIRGLRATQLAVRSNSLESEDKEKGRIF